MAIVSGLVLLLAACYDEGRPETALGATVFGAFQPPAGSVVVKTSYFKASRGGGGLVDCATFTRIFATRDPVEFRGAVYRTAQTAAWRSDQTEASVLPTEGMTDVFRGENEVVELGFWTSGQSMGESVFSARDLAFDWATYTTAAVLEIYDAARSCSYYPAKPLKRVSGRVTDAATGQPVANVVVYKHFAVTDAMMATNAFARDCTGPWTRQSDGRCENVSFAARTAADGTFTFQRDASDSLFSLIRLSFEGPGYKVAWWRDAADWADATDLVVPRSDRNTLITGIDMKLEKLGPP